SARRVITKVVNLLSAKREMGGPAACAHLLGNPDRYTNQSFKTFFWHAYVKEAMRDVACADGRRWVAADVEEKVLLALNDSKVVGLSKIYDYLYRADELEAMSLYEYACRTYVARRSKAEDETEGSNRPASYRRVYSLKSAHSLHKTHCIYELKEGKRYVLDFCGSRLPRKDRGDREFYCATMLVLFAPRGWRRGRDLLGDHRTWSEAFESEVFSSEHLQVMRNMNALYECSDARDDYSAQRRALGKHPTAPCAASEGIEVEQELPPVVDISHTEDEILDVLDKGVLDSNPVSNRKRSEMEHMKDVLEQCGYAELRLRHLEKPEDSRCEADIPPEGWKQRIQNAKEEVLNRRRAQRSRKNTSLCNIENSSCDRKEQSSCRVDYVDAVYVVTQQVDGAGEMFVDAPLQDKNIELLTDVLTSYNLNKDQERAFVIIARSAHHRDTPQLRMYLGGMAGTGKSQVLKALVSFMERRGEASRLMVLAPTGSSACNVDGSTYHSALCLGRDAEYQTELKASKLARLR
ncbi:hypothetical protein OH77DRAFT_1362026, partial [Trametes cingulata]